MDCNYFRDPQKYSVMIIRNGKSLCLLCYYFCQGYSLGDDKGLAKQQNSSSKCNCNTHNHNNLMVSIGTFVIRMNKEFRLRESIPIMNQIFNTKMTDLLDGQAKYLFECDPKHVAFFKYLEKDTSRLYLKKDKCFKWNRLKTPEIQARTSFLQNIRTWFILNDLRIGKKAYIDTDALREKLTLNYIYKIIKFTQRDMEKDSFHPSQQFYSHLLHCYRDLYLKRGVDKLEFIEVSSMERTNPISRIQLRKVNKEYFNQVFSNFFIGRQTHHIFNPVEFNEFCLDKFILEYNSRWIDQDYDAHITVVENIALMFDYGVLKIQQATRLYQKLYQKIQNIKSLQNVVLSQWKKQSKNQMKPSEVQVFKKWAKGFLRIREVVANISLQLIFYKQDDFLTNIISSQKPLKQSDLEETFLTSAFFDEIISKKLIQIILGYFLNNMIIAEENLVSDKLKRLTKGFLFIFAKAHDSYLTGLNLIKQSELERHISYTSLKPGNNRKCLEIEQLAQLALHNFYHRKTTLFNQKQLCKQLSDFYFRMAQYINNASDEQDSEYLDVKIKHQFEETYHRLGHDSRIQAHQVTTTRQKKYNAQKQLYSLNILSYLLLTYKQFYDIMDDRLLGEFYDAFQLLFDKNGALLPLLLNKGILQIFFRNTETRNYSYLAYILYSCFDGQWVAHICNTLKQEILKLFDIYKDAYIKNQHTFRLNQFQKLIKFLQNWEAHPQKSKRFNRFLSSDNIPILQKMLNLLEPMLFNINSESFVQIINQKKFHYQIFVASLRRFAASIQGLYTSNILQNARKIFPLKFFIQTIPRIKQLKVLTSLSIIFQNLYVNMKQNLFTERKEYDKRIVRTQASTLRETFIEETFVVENYTQIIKVVYNMVELVIYRISNNKVNGRVEFQRYVANCVFACLLRLSKYLLNIEQMDTDLFKDYMIGFRDLLNLCVNSERVLCDFLGMEKFFDLQFKVTEFSTKILLFDQMIAKKKEAQMIANIIKKYALYVVKYIYDRDGNKNDLDDDKKVVTRALPYINPQKVSQFKISLISNSYQERNQAIIKTKKMIEDAKMDPKKRLFLIQIAYLRQKLEKLTEQKKNPYLEYLSQIKYIKSNDENQIQQNEQDEEDLQDEEKQLLQNFAKFAISYINFKDPSKRNDTYTFLQFLCNVLFFVTKPVQDQLLEVIKSQSAENPFIEDMWVQIINLWNFTIKKSVQDIYWKDETTKLLILLKFNQFLAEDNNQKWKNQFALTKIGSETPVDILVQMQLYLINWNGWNLKEGGDNLIQLNDRHRTHLFVILYACQDLLTELIIGPNYLCIQIVNSKYSRLYKYYKQILDKYTLSLDSDIYQFKTMILNFLVTIIEGNQKSVLDQLQKTFDTQFLEKIYINSMKQLYSMYRKDLHTIHRHQIQDHKKITNINQFAHISLSDYKKMLKVFREEEQFSQHYLMQISCKIFSYINSIGYEKPVFKVFVSDRMYDIQRIKRNQKGYAFLNPIYKKFRKIQNDESLAIYWFLSKVTIGIEIVREYTDQELLYKSDFAKLQQSLDMSRSLREEPQVQTEIQKQVMVYYFKNPGEVVYLSEQSKSDFEKNVNRESGEKKIYQLLQDSKLFQIQINYNRIKFNQNFKVFNIIENIYYLQTVSFLMALILNILYVVVFMNYSLLPTIGPIITTLSVVQMVFNLILYIIYAVFRLPLDYKINQFQYRKGQRVKKIHLPWNKQVFILFRTVLYSGSITLMLYIIFTLLSLVVIPYFIAFTLLLIVKLSATMTYVLSSVTKYGNQLLFTLLFGYIVVYILTLLNYINFASTFITSPAATQYAPQQQNELIGNTDTNQQICSGLLPCYLNVINHAIRSGNGIVSLQYSQLWQSPNYWKIFFNALLFYYLINIAMNNIFFGIIISTFGDLRDEQTKFDQDRQNRCFMCNLERTEFESEKIDFEDHQNHLHDKWNYVYFLAMLEKKTLKDCNAIENYLKKQIMQKKISWMPLGRSKQLEKRKQDKKQIQDKEAEEDQIQIQMKKLFQDKIAKYRPKAPVAGHAKKR